MSDRRSLYIAGPYTRPDPVLNTHHAIRVATAVYENTAWVPFVPHTTLLWHMVTPRPLDFWYELDLHHLLMCDAFMRLPGESTGADREVAAALKAQMHEVLFADMPGSVRREWVTS